jgi:negative modulator of initiation of replication
VVKTVVVDDELYGYLLNHTQEIGESASAILRRLLGLREGVSRPPGQLEQTFDFLKTPELFRHMNNAQRFLFILSWLYRRHPEDFEKVLLIEGNKRKYFADNSQSLLERGRSVNPRQIPDSPYWVITNNSTAKKHEMLIEVFRMLGYEVADASAVLALLLSP